MRTKILTRALVLPLLVSGFLGTAMAQDSIYSASGNLATVSKYVWRGQRLTNDWSFQPSMTLGVERFSFNAWGSMDLSAVNEGDNLYIPENPLAPAGDNNDGLKGQFSRIDYTFSYARSFENVSVDVGTIFYTFPQRSSFRATTTELYGSVSFDSAPGAPSATIYIDVDETNAGGGDTGLYFLLGAGHSFATTHDVFTRLDLSATVGFVNSGFTKFYYRGLDDGGPHDASITASVPIAINDNWSASAFVTYSGLLGDGIRASQFQDPREAVRPTGATYADTVWGGFSISLGF